MSVIIFFSASSNFFFTEMMCKQMIVCVKAATHLTGVNKTKPFPQPNYQNVQYCMDYITIGIVNIYQNNLHF